MPYNDQIMQSIYFFFLIVLTVSCSNNKSDNKEFLVTENSVGIFIKGMTVKDFLELVPTDQIKKDVDIDDYGNSYDDYKYYDTNQKHLLTLTPKNQDDDNSKIHRVLIIDKSYKTKDSIGLSSTYADLKNHYEITDISPDLEHIVLQVDELNAWFSINKSQLLENWWNDNKKKIEASKIPDSATFDSFVIWWN